MEDLEKVSKEEIYFSGYSLDGVVLGGCSLRGAYKKSFNNKHDLHEDDKLFVFKNGSSYLVAQKEKDLFNITNWYFEKKDSESSGNDKAVIGIQLDLFKYDK